MNSYVLLLISSINATNIVELSILGGHDCNNFISNQDYDFSEECQSSFVAELSIDGKTIGTIPLNLLTKMQVEQLKIAVKSTK